MESFIENVPSSSEEELTKRRFAEFILASLFVINSLDMFWCVFCEVFLIVFSDILFFLRFFTFSLLSLFSFLSAINDELVKFCADCFLRLVCLLVVKTGTGEIIFRILLGDPSSTLTEVAELVEGPSSKGVSEGVDGNSPDSCPLSGIFSCCSTTLSEFCFRLLHVKKACSGTAEGFKGKFQLRKTLKLQSGWLLRESTLQKAEHQNVSAQSSFGDWL